VVPDVLKEYVTFVFKVLQGLWTLKDLGLLEVEGNTFLCNAGNQLPSYGASQSRRLESTKYTAVKTSKLIQKSSNL
jgi:hypothetical protein